MSRIQILPDFIANQIAAGEVVQRPESVIKELVENALDAGADHIYVKIINSGKNLIHIIDNGSGMSKDDLALSIKRHATSKVVSKEDLESIKSFGFRGEALASISSVANLEIRTKEKDNDLGYSLISKPNEEPIIQDVDTSEGTQIIVKNLFFNVPARRKFLRTNITELKYITESMMKFAISHPDIQFTFYDDNNLIFDVKKQSLFERIEEVLGKRISEQIIEFSDGNELIKINGFIGRPEIAKISRAGQFLFLNSRAIQNKSIAHAVVSAFGPLVEKGQHPVFVINLEIDPSKVDINVHPQKHEVKFEDERMVYNLVKNSVMKVLRENDLTRSISISNEILNQPFEKLDNSSGTFVNKDTGEIIQNRVSFPRSENSGYAQGSFRNENDVRNFEKADNAFNEIFGASDFSTSEKKYLQIKNKYIVTETEKGILIIDMHNAHERINYEKAIDMLENEFKNSQKLLFPTEFQLDSNELSMIGEISKELHQLGFGFSIEENDITVFERPLDIKAGQEEKELKELLEHYSEFSELKPTERRENVAASFSCRSSIKTGNKLSEAEMKKLHEDLMKCKTPSVCPHGRPVIMEMSIPDLDKNFGRTPTE